MARRWVLTLLVTSVAPIPMATMMGKEWGGMGQNYLRSLLALGFQAFLIIVCVAIYAVLVQNIATEDDVIAARFRRQMRFSHFTRKTPEYRLQGSKKSPELWKFRAENSGTSQHYRCHRF